MSAVSGFRILCEICTVVVVAESKMSPSVKPAVPLSRAVETRRRTETGTGSTVLLFYSNSSDFRSRQLRIVSHTAPMTLECMASATYNLHATTTSYKRKSRAGQLGRTAGPDRTAGSLAKSSRRS